jgi:hypothetical protein
VLVRCSVNGKLLSIFPVSHLRRPSVHNPIAASPLWETVDMKKPELTDVDWLGPKEEMDRASHQVGKCSECLEIICVEKAVTKTENTQPETTEKLHAAFHAHIRLKHAEDFNQAA